MPVLRATARESSATDEPTDPVAGGGPDGTPVPEPAAGPQPTDTVPEDGERPNLRERLFRRAILLPIACVLAVIVGFLGVTALLSGTDEPAKSDTKPTVTTTAVPAPLPSAAPSPGVAPTAPEGAVPGLPDNPSAAQPPPAPSSPPVAPAPSQPKPTPTTSAPPTTTAPTTTPPTTGSVTGA